MKYIAYAKWCIINTCSLSMHSKLWGKERVRKKEAGGVCYHVDHSLTWHCQSNWSTLRSREWWRVFTWENLLLPRFFPAHAMGFSWICVGAFPKRSSNRGKNKLTVESKTNASLWLVSFSKAISVWPHFFEIALWSEDLSFMPQWKEEFQFWEIDSEWGLHLSSLFNA